VQRQLLVLPRLASLSRRHLGDNGAAPCLHRQCGCLVLLGLLTVLRLLADASGQTGGAAAAATELWVATVLEVGISAGLVVAPVGAALEVAISAGLVVALVGVAFKAHTLA